MNIGKVLTSGYAPATAGGVSFMVELEAPQGRFEGIEKNETYALSIVVLCEAPHKVRATVCSASGIGTEEVSFFGLDEDNEANDLTPEEYNEVLVYCEQLGILKKSKEIIRDYDVLMQKILKDRSAEWDEATKLPEKPQVEDFIAQMERMKQLRSKIDGWSQGLRELERFEFSVQ